MVNYPSIHLTTIYLQSTYHLPTFYLPFTRHLPSIYTCYLCHLRIPSFCHLIFILSLCHLPTIYILAIDLQSISYLPAIYQLSTCHLPVYHLFVSTCDLPTTSQYHLPATYLSDLQPLIPCLSSPWRPCWSVSHPPIPLSWCKLA